MKSTTGRGACARRQAIKSNAEMNHRRRQEGLHGHSVIVRENTRLTPFKKRPRGNLCFVFGQQRGCRICDNCPGKEIGIYSALASTGLVNTQSRKSASWMRPWSTNSQASRAASRISGKLSGGLTVKRSTDESNSAYYSHLAYRWGLSDLAL